jgi:oligoribonuclease NrnB/cAMP/cGMP phosphodiesterase (DHH superfamily)
MDTICFHHNDLDGIVAAAIVRQYYPDAKMIPINYSDSLTEDVEGKRIIVVDFSFKNMEELKEKCAELIWCDHHKTARDDNRKVWNDTDVKGCRSLEYAGCALTYAYFNNISITDLKAAMEDAKTPAVIRYAGTYDMWKFTEGDATDAFCATAFVKLHKPDAPDFEQLMANSYDMEAHYIRTGEILVQAAIDRVKKVAHREEIKVSKTPSGNITFLIVNSTSDLSRLGSYINKELGCDIAVMFEVINNHCRVSLRSLTRNVEVIAHELSGGGHVGAAGYTTAQNSREMYDELVATIYMMHSKSVKK